MPEKMIAIVHTNGPVLSTFQEREDSSHKYIFKTTNPTRRRGIILLKASNDKLISSTVKSESAKAFQNREACGTKAYKQTWQWKTRDRHLADEIDESESSGWLFIEANYCRKLWSIINANVTTTLVISRGFGSLTTNNCIKLQKNRQYDRTYLHRSPWARMAFLSRLFPGFFPLSLTSHWKIRSWEQNKNNVTIRSV